MEISDGVRNILLTLWEAKNKPGLKAWAIHVALTYAINRDPNVNKRELWKLIKDEYVANLLKRFPDQVEPGQSYRRAAGDAFEMFVEEYLNTNDTLIKNGIRAVSLSGEPFARLVDSLNVDVRVRDVDLFLQGIDQRGSVRIFGALFPKASYAERIRADEGASRKLMDKEIWTGTVTMDARGELGTEERPSVKRKTINSGAFNGCYSFNQETAPGPHIHIVRCNIRGMRNPLIRDIVRAWRKQID